MGVVAAVDDPSCVTIGVSLAAVLGSRAYALATRACYASKALYGPGAVVCLASCTVLGSAIVIACLMVNVISTRGAHSNVRAKERRCRSHYNT